MRKFLFFTSLLYLLVFLNANARPVDKLEAITLAKNYFSKASSGAMRVKAEANYELVYVGSDKKIPDDAGGNQNYFYVYNIGKNNGFVIVSADTRAKQVLAYSSTGSFNVKRLPENLKSWLQFYSEEIKYAIEKLPDVSEYQTLSGALRKASSNVNTVAPLLGSIRYDQDVPYNDSCPAITNNSTTPPTVTKTVVGCGATAIAQIMRYYQWPLRGAGTKTYTTKTREFNLTANFGNTEYDWANMLPFYTGNETDTQKAAVAKLMSHVGIGLEMDYDLESSSSIFTAVTSLYNHFGYDAGIQRYSRDFFKKTEWADKIKTELNAGRPVAYRGGSASGAGHLFVCDGYDTNDMFHINWGWSGYSDGYYELSALNPGSQGIGASNGGYNLGQWIITGIQKPVEGSVHTQVVGVDSLKVSTPRIVRNGTVNVNAINVFNYGSFVYNNAQIGVGLYQNDILTHNIIVYEFSTISAFSGWDNLAFDNITFDSAIPNGNYQMRLIYLNEKGDYVPVRAKNGGVGVIDVEVTNDNINFTPTDSRPALALAATPTVLYNLYQNKKGYFDLQISNTGGGEYLAQIGIKLTSTDNPSVQQTVKATLVQINAGEIKTIQLGDSIKLAPGTYSLSVYYDPANIQNSASFPTELMGPGENTATVMVNPTPTTAPELSLVGNAVVPTSVKQGEDFTLTATIQNSGGYLADDVIAFVFPMASGGSVGYYGLQGLVLENNTSKVVQFSGNLLLDVNSYRTALFCRNGTSWKRISDMYTFSVEALTTGISSAATALGFNLMENPVKEEIRVALPDNAVSLVLYTLQGKQVQSVSVSGERSKAIPAGDLASGVYLLTLQTKTSTATIKFIKE